MSRKIIFADNAWEDYLYWQANDKQILKKLNALIKEVQRESPLTRGSGKAELLKDYSGYRSKRINQRHRLVYKVTENSLWIAQCRDHY